MQCGYPATGSGKAANTSGFPVIGIGPPAAQPGCRAVGRRDHAAGFGRRAAGVTITVECDDVFVDIDRAMPCGLIINEVLSNCFKHAFPGGRPGRVTVLVRGAQQNVTLSVKDDGVGLPPGFNLDKANTLGLRLTTGLVKQLKGTYELHSDNGTLFKLTFPNA